MGPIGDQNVMIHWKRSRNSLSSPMTFYDAQIGKITVKKELQFTNVA